jgi:hypothetical protein
MTDLTPEELAFLIKIGQIEAPTNTPKTTAKKDEE